MPLKTVTVPEAIEPVFRQAEKVVSQFFSQRKDSPESGSIEVFGSRYVLIRGASLSVEFFLLVRKLFGNGNEEAADSFTATLLYDLAHAVGKTDAQNFHEKMNLRDPIERLSAGPVHFAHTGWAYVNILPESRPTPDEDCYIVYDHPYSFEADAWVTNGTRPSCPTCVMNAGYSSGWCEESFGVLLESREIACRALGHDRCRFVLSSPAKIQGHVEQYYKTHPKLARSRSYFTRPDFFARQEVLEAISKGDDWTRTRTVAEKQLLAYARKLETTQAALKEKVRQLEVEVQERARAEEQYRDLVERINDVVFAVNREGTFSYISPVVEKIANITVAEIIGQSFRAFVHPEDLGGLMESFSRSMGGELMPHEFRVRSGNGDIRHVRTFSRPIIEDGQVIGLRGVMTDISDRKEAENLRERLITELEDKNNELERFTYTVSHDLKSPLVTIKGFLGLLQKDIAAGTPNRIEDDISHISEAVHKMHRLLDELLELSRIGRLVNPTEENSLSEIVREARALVGGQVAEIGAVVHIQDDLPKVYGDRIRLVQVFQNLIDNALKFMGDQEKPRVEISAETSGDKVICYVRDNGIGIDPQFHEKIFGLFDRLDVRGEGTGIGLALVKRIIEVHGGDISVDSDGNGKGSTFRFSLSREAN